MGKNSRDRRKAKQRHRRQSAAGHDHSRQTAGPDRAQILERLVYAFSDAARFPGSVYAEGLLKQFRGFERELDVAADIAVQEALHAAWQHGWSPLDLHEIARRRVDTAAARYLDEAIALESRRYSVATLHPQWRAELAAIAPAAVPPSTAPQLWRWAAAHTADERSAVTTVLQILNLLGRLPAVEALVPRPGAHDHTHADLGEADERMLARVRALLAKAEATEYPDEAEALSAKAQALMAQHSLREALAEHDRGRAPATTARRLWIDNPYVAAKVSLVQVVAQANSARTVWMKDLGCVTVVGSEADLDLIELLVTSLLVQANRAMMVAGRSHAVRGQSRTKSFRQSFLVAYAARIGERLTEANSAVVDELIHDDRLLPVLAARTQAADEAFTRLFPRTVARPVTAYDSVGLGAGRAAAETATLDVRDSIAG